MKTIIAADLTDKLAPVSGARCRGCGTRPYYHASATWFIEHKTAYCPQCWEEDHPSFAGAPRYHVSMFDDGGEWRCTALLPLAVETTILAALLRGIRSGTVEHLRSIPTVSGLHPEIYCWDIS